jgi:hypothetical protein
MKQFFGSDRVCFTINSTVQDSLEPCPVTIQFSDALEEVDARIYGGCISGRSTRIGAKLGKEVARYTTNPFFRPNRDHGGPPQ